MTTEVTDRPTILIGFAESFAAVEAAWSLRAAGFGVMAFARRGSRPPLRHDHSIGIEWVTAPEQDVDACVADLQRLASSGRFKALLPLDDGALWLTTALDLGDCVLIGPDAAAAAVALDKSRQVALAADAGLSVPPSEVVLLSEAEWRGEAVILKPAAAVQPVANRLTRPAGRFCGSAAEFERAKAELPEGVMLAQPVLSGVGVGVFGAGLGDRWSPLSAHRRVRMVNPAGSASSACDSIPVDPDLAAGTEKMLTELNWRGLFMTEFLLDQAGHPWFMELNGRAWGSLALARRRGYEYPAWAAQAALGIPVQPDPPSNPPDIRARHAGREIAHLAFVLRGPTSAALDSWPGRRSTVRNLLRWSRRDRLYNWEIAHPLVLLADTWRTVADQVARLGRKRS